MRRGSDLSLDVFGDRVDLSRRGADDGGEHRRMLRTLSLAARGELTGRQLECVRLRYGKGESVSEIASELRVAPSTVSRHLKKARLRLHRVLRYAYPLLDRPDSSLCKPEEPEKHGSGR